jgi:hypothetical protein
MMIDESLLQITEYAGTGYQPLIDFANWRVAILRYHEELLPQHIEAAQRHDETDEVFVLLAGRCILFIGEGHDRLTCIQAEDLQPLKLYNVKKSTWHTHTLSRDATVLIVENRDTVVANSPQIALTAAQREQLIHLTQILWKDTAQP